MLFFGLFVAFMAALLTNRGTHGRIPLSQFYPYGEPANDLNLPAADDVSTPISISFRFPFFGSAYDRLFISTNGLISFELQVSAYTATSFPSKTLKAVAIYWTDSDLRNVPGTSGRGYYRQTDEPAVLRQITADIRTHIVGQQTFKASWALIATYDNVSTFLCTANDSVSGPDTTCRKTLCKDTATHQTVLASDGIRSFVIMNFNKLDYTRPNVNCNENIHAQVGFNAGDGKRYYVIPDSITKRVASSALSGSNIGVPGKWMFSVGEVDISEGCNDRGLIELYPRKLLYFARQTFFISGPCFEDVSNDTLNVKIGKSIIDCSVNRNMQITCIAPLLDKLGINSVSLVYKSVTYESFVIAVDVNDPIVGDAIFQASQSADPDHGIHIQWNVDNTTDEVSENISFRGFQKNYAIDKNGLFNIVEVVQLEYGKNPNNGSVILYPPSRTRQRREASDPKFRQTLIVGILSNSDMIKIAGTVVTSFENEAELREVCLAWNDRQPSNEGMVVIVDDLSQRNPCPPAVPPGNPRIFGNYAVDQKCAPKGKSKGKTSQKCDVFHPNASVCYRSTNTRGDSAATQCCYDERRRLVLGPLRGGRVNFVDPGKSLEGNFEEDELSFLICCTFLKTGEECEKYTEKRPSIPSVSPRIVRSVNSGGDPHFTTPDGTSYTFNPVGEFTYLRAIASNETIQTRISQYTDEQGNNRNACYFSAFVFKSADTVVQVELNTQKTAFTFYLQGQRMELEYGAWNFDAIGIDYQNGTFVLVYLNSGISVELLILSKMLHIILFMPESLKGQIDGLIGNWDGDSANDLQLPNGTWIPSDSSPATVHYEFGMAWQTTNESSLFMYPRFLNWSDYQYPDFLPNFQAPDLVPACRGDAECSYDVMLTGDVSIGLSNLLRREREAESVRANDELLINSCPISVSALNGNVTVRDDIIAHAIDYKLKCREGFTLEGRDHVTCVNGSYTSLGICRRAVKRSASNEAVVNSVWCYTVIITSLLRCLIIHWIP